MSQYLYFHLFLKGDHVIKKDRKHITLNRPHKPV